MAVPTIPTKIFKGSPANHSRASTTMTRETVVPRSGCRTMSTTGTPTPTAMSFTKVPQSIVPSSK